MKRRSPSAFGLSRQSRRAGRRPVREWTQNEPVDDAVDQRVRPDSHAKDDDDEREAPILAERTPRAEVLEKRAHSVTPWVKCGWGDVGAATMSRCRCALASRRRASGRIVASAGARGGRITDELLHLATVAITKFARIEPDQPRTTVIENRPEDVMPARLRAGASRAPRSRDAPSAAPQRSRRVSRAS